MTSSYRLVFFEPDTLSGTRLLLGAIVETEEGTFRVRQAEPWWLSALSGRTRALAIHLHHDMALDNVDMSQVSPLVRMGEKREIPFPDPVRFVREPIVEARQPATMAVQEEPLPDVYQIAADVAGLKRDDVISKRSADCIAARWGVWSALHAIGWGFSDIAKRSCDDRVWDHSTIISAMKGVRGSARKDLINAVHRATYRAVKEKRA